uniref:Uncharacterized protein n=1 Tax=Ananas comosus var. bracteatus TaxID=296719 RepID=A0A6V7NWT4_ANACO|nr:unnamed protein product [Ananas comosus var. bracteatus]
MEDLSGYRCFIAVNHLSDIPKNLDITFGELSISVSIQLEGWDRADAVGRGYPPNERSDKWRGRRVRSAVRGHRAVAVPLRQESSLASAPLTASLPLAAPSVEGIPAGRAVVDDALIGGPLRQEFPHARVPTTAAAPTTATAPTGAAAPSLLAASPVVCPSAGGTAVGDTLVGGPTKLTISNLISVDHPIPVQSAVMDSSSVRALGNSFQLARPPIACSLSNVINAPSAVMESFEIKAQGFLKVVLDKMGFGAAFFLLENRWSIYFRFSPSPSFPARGPFQFVVDGSDAQTGSVVLSPSYPRSILDPDLPSSCWPGARQIFSSTGPVLGSLMGRRTVPSGPPSSSLLGLSSGFGPAGSLLPSNCPLVLSSDYGPAGCLNSYCLGPDRGGPSAGSLISDPYKACLGAGSYHDATLTPTISCGPHPATNVPLWKARLLEGETTQINHSSRKWTRKKVKAKGLLCGVDLPDDDAKEFLAFLCGKV